MTTTTGSVCLDGLPSGFVLSNSQDCANKRTGQTCSVVCKEGFVGEPETWTCQADGSFTGTAPTCQEATCSANTIQGYDDSSCDGILFGDGCSVQCLPGFEAAVARFECDSQGELQGSPPTCDKLQCQEESLPIAKGVNYTDCEGTTAGRSCFLTCGEYYIGNATEVDCMTTGDFNGSAPTCTLLTCDTPPALETNPTFAHNCAGAKHGTSCVVECGEGYLGLPSEFACSAPTLSGNLPNCTPVECKTNLPFGAWVDAGDCIGKTTGETCTPTCEPGYMSVGAAMPVTCGESNIGAFSDSNFTCQPKTCEDLSGFGDFQLAQIENNCQNLVAGQTCAAWCGQGYELIGKPSILVCASISGTEAFGGFMTGDGSFNVTAPTCQALPCTFNIPNQRWATHDCGQIFTGETCTLGIPSQGWDYDKRDGQATKVCDASGALTGRDPVVYEWAFGASRAAPGTGALEHTCGGLTAGTSCWVFCSVEATNGAMPLAGYTIAYGPNATTREDLYLDLQSGYAALECSGGRRLGAERTLSATGDCDASLPSLNLDQPSLSHSCEGRLNQEQCVVSCAAGYVLEDPDDTATMYKCNVDTFELQFGSAIPGCIGEVCTNEMPQGIGVVSDCAGRRTGENCTATCDEGYELANGTTQESFACEAGRSFNGSSPTCVPKQCTALSLPVMYRTTQCNGLVTGQDCYVDCADGFTISGSPQTYDCLPNGTISGTLPTCVPNSCPLPVSAEYNTATCGNFTTYDTCTIMCANGYEGGHMTIDCLTSGATQITSSATCTRMVCSPTDIPVVPGVQNTCGDVEFESSCSLACAAGYTLRAGASYQNWQCLWDAPVQNVSLQGTQPLCDPLPCQDGFPMGDTFEDNCTGVRTAEFCIATCGPGYQGTPEVFNCQASGVLQGSAPACALKSCNENSYNGTAPGLDLTGCPSVTFGSDCFATCASGWIGASTTLSCALRSDGEVELTGPLPQCTEISCDGNEPTGLEYTSNCTGTTPGVNCTISCLTPFEGPSADLVCTVTGDFQGSLPTCLLPTSTTTVSSMTQTSNTTTLSSSTTGTATLTKSSVTQTASSVTTKTFTGSLTETSPSLTSSITSSATATFSMTSTTSATATATTASSMTTHRCACVYEGSTLPSSFWQNGPYANEANIQHYGTSCNAWDSVDGTPWKGFCPDGADFCSSSYNWCSAPWCYVDNSLCSPYQDVTQTSVFYPNSLYYSYGACGAPNCYGTTNYNSNACPYDPTNNCTVTNTLSLSSTVSGVDYTALTGNSTLQALFEASCQTSVAAEISAASGINVSANAVTITLSAGSVSISASVSLDSSVDTTSVTSSLGSSNSTFASSLASTIASVPGITEATTGVISVSSPVTAIAVSASSSSSSSNVTVSIYSGVDGTWTSSRGYEVVCAGGYCSFNGQGSFPVTEANGIVEVASMTLVSLTFYQIEWLYGGLTVYWTREATITTTLTTSSTTSVSMTTGSMTTYTFQALPQAELLAGCTQLAFKLNFQALHCSSSAGASVQCEEWPTRVPCNDVFTTTTLALLGAAPVCSWSSDRTAFYAQLGVGANIAVGSAVTVPQNVLLHPNQPVDELLTALVGNVSAQDRELSVQLTAFPAVAEPCSDVTFSPRLLSGSCARSASYAWSLGSDTSLPFSVNTQLQAAISAAQNFPALVLSGKLLREAASSAAGSSALTLQVRLQTATWLGESSETTATVSVLRTAAQSPQIVPLGPLTRNVEAYEPVQAAVYIPTSCGASMSSIAWDIRSGAGSNWQPLGSDTDPQNASVELAPFTFQPNSQHVLRARATYEQASASTSVEFTIAVAPRLAPMPQLRGPREVSQACGFTLDASGSRDPWDATASASGLSYSWSCAPISGSGSCSPASLVGSGASLTSSALQVTGGQLQVGSYNFTVAVQSSAGSSTAAWTVQVTASNAGMGPPAVLATPWLDGERQSVQRAGPLGVNASLHSGSGCTLPTTWASAWALVELPAEAFVHLLVAPAAASSQTTELSTGAVGLPGPLRPGATYAVVLVRAGSVAALQAALQSINFLSSLPATFAVDVSASFVADAQPLVQGPVQILPDQGQQLSTVFAIATQAWQDESQSGAWNGWVRLSELVFSFWRFPAGSPDPDALDWENATSANYWVKHNGTQLSAWSARQDLAVMMPHGSYSIVVRVQDALGGMSTAYTTGVVVQELPCSAFSLSDAVEQIKGARVSQDVFRILNVLEVTAVPCAQTCEQSFVDATEAAFAEVVQETGGRGDIVQRLGQSMATQTMQTLQTCMLDSEAAVLPQMMDSLADTLLSTITGSGGLEQGPAESLLRAQMALVDAHVSSESGETAARQAFTTKMREVSLALGTAVASMAQPGQAVVLNAVGADGAGVELAAQKETFATLQSGGSTFGGVLPSGAVVLPSVGAGRLLSASCDEVTVLQTAYHKTNIYFWASSSVLPDATVKTVSVTLCGAVAQINNSSGQVTLTVPVSWPSVAGLLPRCVRFDESSASWTSDGVTLSGSYSQGDASLTCLSSLGSATYSVEFASPLPAALGGSSALLASTTVIFIVIISAVCLCFFIMVVTALVVRSRIQKKRKKLRDDDSIDIVSWDTASLAEVEEARKSGDRVRVGLPDSVTWVDDTMVISSSQFENDEPEIEIDWKSMPGGRSPSHGGGKSPSQGGGSPAHGGPGEGRLVLPTRARWSGNIVGNPARHSEDRGFGLDESPAGQRRGSGAEEAPAAQKGLQRRAAAAQPEKAALDEAPAGQTAWQRRASGSEEVPFAPAVTGWQQRISASQADWTGAGDQAPPTPAATGWQQRVATSQADRLSQTFTEVAGDLVAGRTGDTGYPDAAQEPAASGGGWMQTHRRELQRPEMDTSALASRAFALIDSAPSAAPAPSGRRVPHSVMQASRAAKQQGSRPPSRSQSSSRAAGGSRNIL